MSPLLALLTLGCAAEPSATLDDTGAAALFPPPPDGGVQLVTPELEIPAYSERQLCYFGTWDGPDVGLHASEGFQEEGGHHVTLLGTNYTVEEYPDGALVDCTDEEQFDMLRMDPLFIQGSYDPAYAGGASLPVGMAIELRSGQRWVVQAHYINTTGEALLVRDAMNLALTPADEVETWAATYAHSTLSLSVPPGEAASTVIDCTFDAPYSLLNVSGHMHEHGTAFRAVHGRAGVEQVLYEVPSWTPAYRDEAPMTDFGAAPYEIQAGDTLTTTCTWFNGGEVELRFPEEMCATVGVLYPRREALTCVDL